MENTIFKLIEIKYGNKNPQYPKFEVYSETMGYFSSVFNAEQAIKEYVVKWEEYEGVLSFGFLIKEHVLDLAEGSATKSERSYLSDGSFWDETNESQLSIDSRCITSFEGRSEEKIRFKPGDIVEMVFEYEEYVSLGIVHCTPPTIEEAKKRVAPDDLYYATPHNATWGDGGCTHYHLSPVDLFPPRFPVSDKLQKKLKKVYKGIQKEVFRNDI